MTTLIVYRFTKAQESYQAFFDEIHSLAKGEELELFDGCILMPFGMTALGLRNRLRPFLAPADRLFLCNFAEDCAGQLPQRQKNWLKEHVFWFR